MKTKKLYLLVLLVSSVFILNTCSKNDNDNEPTTDNCEVLIDAVSNAVITYSNNPTRETCENAVDAISDFYEGCTAAEWAAQRDEYEQWLDDVDCSEFPSE